MATIVKRLINGRAYYYISRSFRVKDASNASGKTRGSGKSHVRTEQIYLGTIEDVIKKVQTTNSPEKIRTASFGIEAAAWQVIQELDLVGIVDRHVAKRHQGLSVGQYIAVALINRLVRPSSKAGMSDWLKSSALSSLTTIEPGLMKSQNFWDAFDKMIHQPSRRGESDANQQESILDDQVIRDIEHGLWEQLLTLYDVPLDPILYDTTNYFNHLDALTPGELSRYAHSKDGKKNKRCVGLAMAQSLSYDLPIFHLVYAANRHDAKLFPTAIQRITEAFAGFTKRTRGTTLVMDKGNNSQANVELAVQKHGFVLVGSLVPRHFPDLMQKQLRSYTHSIQGRPAFSKVRDVFGIPSMVVVTYNAGLRKRQLLRLETRLQETEEKVQALIASFKPSDSKKKMEERIRRLLRARGMTRYLTVTVGGRRHKTFSVEKNLKELRAKRRMLGKNILFCTDKSRAPEVIVDQYRKRDRLEKSFRLSKGRDGIPFRPMHCWTDSKIRIFCFVCVLALLVWRLMHLKLSRAGFPMSDAMLRLELSDIREVTLLYPANKAERRLSECSSVQRQLLSIFGCMGGAPPE